MQFARDENGREDKCIGPDAMGLQRCGRKKGDDHQNRVRRKKMLITAMMSSVCMNRQEVGSLVVVFLSNPSRRGVNVSTSPSIDE